MTHQSTSSALLELADIEAAEGEFTDYFVRNYPGPDTVIYNPRWHAPKIFRAALHTLRSRATGAEE